MLSSQAEKTRVSLEAFQEQVSNWELTLSRQQRKLKSLRSSIHSKIHLNELDILATQIETQIIKYRKFKDQKKMQGFDVIQSYNSASRKFMEIMESIGAFADKIDTADETLQLDSLELGEGKNYSNISAPRYHDETFTYAISKQPKKNKSLSNTPHLSKGKASHKNSVNHQSNSLNATENLTKQRKKPLGTSFNRNLVIGDSKLGFGSTGEEFDSWEIRYQLKQIKSMMSQIRNQIKYHNHEDVESELSKIQHNNKKMGLQLKALKEDNQFIITRMQKLKQQLAVEKQIQSQMIQQFENPQRRSRKSKGQAASETNNCSVNEDVSDWVRVRI